MAGETYPLLRRFREGQFENCIILTYNADLFFYEQVVLATLRSRGCYNNLVFMDLRQYSVALESSHAVLYGAGRTYSIWPVSAPSAFHPKIILLSGEKHARLVVGSGNLTIRGMSSNWEVFSETERTEEGESDGLFRQTWEFIQSLARDAPRTVVNQLRQASETCPWLEKEAPDGEWPKLLFGRPNGSSLAHQLANAIGNRSIRRLTVVAPFFDRQLRGLKELTKVLMPKEVALIVQPQNISLPGDLLAGLKQALPYSFDAGSGAKPSAAYLHAKVYVIETADTEFCMWGSPNCSRSALAATHDDGNIEIALLDRGKRGHFLSLLDLTDSLSRQAIDPGTLKWRGDQKSPNAASLQIVSAELHGEQIEVRLGGLGVSRKEAVGHLVLTAGTETLATIEVNRTAAGSYCGKWTSAPDTARTVVCRVVLGSGNESVESAPAAVHFASVLARETPSRSARNIRKLLRDIETRSAEWAQGLEGVYELFFKVESHAMGSAATRMAAPKRDKGKQDEQGAVRAFQHFVSDAKSGVDPSGWTGFHSGLLLDFVRMLSARLLQGIEGKELEDVDDSDSWKYREELEKDTADSGERTQQLSSDERVRLHRLVRRGYVKLMTALTKRFETMRDDQREVSCDEALRLYLVTTLCIAATDRLVEDVRTCGPVLRQDDLAENLLPAIAIFLGRVKHVQKSAGPLFANVAVDPANEYLRDAALSVCILLSSLTAYRKRRLNDDSLGQKEDAAKWNRFCVEITSARSLAVLEESRLLPSADEFSRAVNRCRDRSPWMSSLRVADILATFAELCKRGGAILRVEANPPQVGPGTLTSAVREGDWVYSPIAGVTEVVDISGKNVTLKMVGGHYLDGSLETKVAATHVRPVGMSSARKSSSTGWPLE